MATATEEGIGWDGMGWDAMLAPCNRPTWSRDFRASTCVQEGGEGGRKGEEMEWNVFLLAVFFGLRISRPTRLSRGEPGEKALMGWLFDWKAGGGTMMVSWGFGG